LLPRIRTLAAGRGARYGNVDRSVHGLAIAGDELALGLGGAAVRRGRRRVRVGAAPWPTRENLGVRARWTLMRCWSLRSLFTAIMQSAGIPRRQARTGGADAIRQTGCAVANVGKMLNELVLVLTSVGGSCSTRSTATGFPRVLSGGRCCSAARRRVRGLTGRLSAAGERRPGGSRAEVSPKLVHVAFWSTCLTVGLLLFLLSSVGSVDYASGSGRGRDSQRCYRWPLARNQGLAGRGRRGIGGAGARRSLPAGVNTTGPTFRAMSHSPSQRSGRGG